MLAAVIVMAAAVALLAFAVGWHVAEQYRGAVVAARRRVVVNLVDDHAVSGILWRRHKTLVVVRGAELIEPGREPVPVDGEVVIERARIAFTQIVGSD